MGGLLFLGLGLGVGVGVGAGEERLVYTSASILDSLKHYEI